jgi:hypothetical protein
MKPHQEQEPLSKKWTSILIIDYPEGVTRHPSVLDRIQEEISCIVNIEYPGVLMSYYVNADNHSSAEFEARAVASNILSFLGLTHAAIAEHTITTDA